MLATETLWFSRVDCFDDHWEGQTSDAALEKYNSLALPRDVLRAIVEKLRVIPYVNCWTGWVHESVGVWKTFVPSPPGVVIRSTAGRLERALDSERDCHVGNVRYVDYGIDVVNDAFSKRHEFESEREIRAAFYDFEQYTAMMDGTNRTELPKGQPVVVRLQDLITEVRLAPKSEASLRAVVENILTKAGLHVPVRASELDTPPPT